jgi:hypothetical protein
LAKAAFGLDLDTADQLTNAEIWRRPVSAAPRA